MACPLLVLDGVGVLVQGLKVYGFATPACMDSRLSEECRDFTHSVVFRDDIVPRFSPEALLNLNDQINDFDAEQEIDVSTPSHLLSQSLLLLVPQDLSCMYSASSLNEAGEMRALVQLPWQMQ